MAYILGIVFEGNLYAELYGIMICILVSEEEEKRQCYCPPCCAKRDVMNRKEPRRKTMKKLT